MLKVERIKKKFFDELKYMIMYGYLGRVFASIIALIVMPAPFYVYLFAKWGFEPVGFWQNLALFGVWALVLGWLQVIIAIACIAFIIGILTDTIY